jgi:secondary thiamine-phosphate synthase enzyme
MLRQFTIQTSQKLQFKPITDQVRQAVLLSEVQEGLAVVFCPHTTAGLTINENADPMVANDLLLGLETAFPENPRFLHQEGNSAAHLKALATGSSVEVIILSGRLLLGTWQGIFFAEFDGPRDRTFYVKILKD